MTILKDFLTAVKEARVALVDILFDEFRESRDPKTKLDIFNQTKQLLIKNGDDILDYDALVNLALMARIVATPIECYSILQNVFDHCYAELTDLQGGNDEGSFRLLSRCLACAPGLERDALIALSCQFYNVDKSLIWDLSDDSDSDDEQSDSDTNEGNPEHAATQPDASDPTIIDSDADGNHQDEVNGATIDVNPKSTSNEVELGRTAQIPVTQQQDETTSPDKVLTDIKVNGDELNGSNIENAEGEGEESPEQSKENAKEDVQEPITHADSKADSKETPNDQVDASTTTTHVEVSTKTKTTIHVNADGHMESTEVKTVEVNVTSETVDEQSAKTEYDLAPTGIVSCDGVCDDDPDAENYHSWTVPIYHCLLCADVDLCQACHQKRLAQNKTDEELYWRRYCGKEHSYIKGPIEGWKGIKDGVIEIGDEKTVFKEWLEDLKTVRWRKTWQETWTGRRLVKDINNVGN